MKKWLRPTAGKRILFFLSGDLVLSMLTLYLSYKLRFNFSIDPLFLSNFWKIYLLLTGLKVASIALVRGYTIVWRFFGFEDAKNLLKAHLLAYTLFGILYWFFGDRIGPFPRSVLGIDLFLSLIALGAFRSFRRLLLEYAADRDVQPALIYGANGKTAGIIRSALNGDVPYCPVAIVADRSEREMVGSHISGIRVYGAEELERVVARKEIRVALLARTPKRRELKSLVERLNEAGVREIKRIRLLGNQEERLEDLSVEELLARYPQDLDTEAIAAFIRGKRVLITGGGGSIGSEIARQCRRFGASALALVDHSEFNLYTVGEEIPEAETAMFSVTERELLDRELERFRPDLVIHAAAYKHVPLCEANPEAAVRNNVLGTKNVVDACIEAGVEKLVIISTDKAVRPTNVMGATKRVTELYAGNVESRGTEIVAVRFGNVLGSSGSVIPKFKRQIEAGGPVTVTHPEMTRYFMLIPEACQLVLQAAAIARGGELFILDMGEPVKIVDLARTMIRLYGREGEVEIVFTGLRPGEKLYEELLIDASEQKTRYRSIFIAGKTDYPIEALERDIAELLEAEEKVALLRKIVPEYRPEGSESF